jgi:cell division protein FtsB
MRQPGPRIPISRQVGRAARWVVIAVGFVVLVDSLVGDKGFLATYQARQRYRDLEATLAAARQENAQLREHARRLREDPATVEDIARRELGLIKPGEKMFIIRDAAPPQPH